MWPPKFCFVPLTEDNRSVTDTPDINVFGVSSLVTKLHVVQIVLLPIIVHFGSIHNLYSRTEKERTSGMNM